MLGPFPDSEAAAPAPKLAQADALWCPGSTRLPRSVLEGAPRLRWIGDTSGGPPHLDYRYAAQRGLVVTDCRRAFAPAVGEMALALYLAVVRDVVHDRALHTPERTEGTAKAANREASGRTIGLVGWIVARTVTFLTSYVRVRRRTATLPFGLLDRGSCRHL